MSYAEPFHSLANYLSALMAAHRHATKRVDVVDLDPYGTAAPFIDSAVSAIADGGELLSCKIIRALLMRPRPALCDVYRYSGICWKCLSRESVSLGLPDVHQSSSVLTCAGFPTMADLVSMLNIATKLVYDLSSTRLPLLQRDMVDTLPLCSRFPSTFTLGCLWSLRLVRRK